MLSLALTLILLIWLPFTNTYQLHPEAGGWLWWCLLALMGALGWGLWHSIRERMILMLIAPQALDRRGGTTPPRRQPRALPWRLRLLPPQNLRWLFLVGYLGLTGLLVLVLPQEAEWQGGGYSGAWYVAVGAAICAGIFFGRWILAQAETAGQLGEPLRFNCRFPSWWKWANLALLVIGALLAAFGQGFWPNDNESVRFGLAAVGFSVGILGAIWLARRFDEMGP